MSGSPGQTGPEADARALVRRLGALEEGPIRSGAAARALARMEPERGVEAIAWLVRAAASSPQARLAVAAVVQALAAPGAVPYGWLAEAYAAAARGGVQEVASLFVAPSPHRAHEAPPDPDPRLSRLTLGHKKALARAHRDPDLLARLAAEGDPAVVRELLGNPQLTESFVIRIAARRPCRPETLRCIFEARRWRTRPAVALALARNPYVETGIALKLLPALAPRELGEVAHDGALHPLVRAAAARLAAARA